MSDEVKKTPEELKKENNLNFAKSMSSAVSAIDELQTAIISRRKSTTDRIANLMQDPNKTTSVNALQQEEELMRSTNGILREVMFYKSNLPTYDHYLIVSDASKYKTKDKLDKDYFKAVTELERYNIKPFCRWVIEEVIRKGEIYTYKQDGDNITYFRIPNSLCKVTHMDGMLQGYAIKLDGITEKTLPAYPNDIQKLWKKYKAGKLRGDKNLLKSNYYKISIDKGVAFTIDLWESKNAPYYASLLLDLSRIADLNDINMETALTENFKLIHQLLPSDDNGDISIDYDTASMYNQALQNVLPQGVGGLSSPYEISAVTLNSNNSTKTYSYLTELKDNLYNSSGVDSSLFNSQNRSNTQAILYSGIIDSFLAFNLLDRIKIWLNFDFKNNKLLKNFKIVFVDSTAYNKDSKAQAALNNSTTWSSRLELQALLGRSPLEAYNLLRMEYVMNLDEYMIPLANSHTMSSDDIQGEAGRPRVEEENPTQAPANDSSSTIRE